MQLGLKGLQAGQPLTDQGVITITEPVADLMATLGANWVRIHFRLGPFPADVPDFYAAYDTIVGRLLNKNLSIVGLVSYETWPGSQADWQANNFERQGGSGFNDYLNQLGWTFLNIANHFVGRVPIWEIWNEPNCYSYQNEAGELLGCSYIYPSNFAALLAHCFALTKYYNVDAELISGGVLGHDLNGLTPEGAGADYLNATYNSGYNLTGQFRWSVDTFGMTPFHGLGQHIYVDQNGLLVPINFTSYLDMVRGVGTSWGDDKPTVITEFGWPSIIGQKNQARNVTRAYKALKKAACINGGAWFQLFDIPEADLHYGLYYTDWSEKASARAYRALSS